MKEKFNLYETCAIPEYWIVDPEHQDIVIYTLNAEGQYIGSRPYMAGDNMRSSVLDGLAIDVSEVFG
jgi:Uma2 family endonuclease